MMMLVRKRGESSGAHYRLVPGTDGYAEEGEMETTSKPTCYPFGAREHVRLWDIPGAGSARQPANVHIVAKWAST